MIHSSCTPSEHVVNIAKKANGILSQLNRTLICRNQEIIVSMFKTFIRFLKKFKEEQQDRFQELESSAMKNDSTGVNLLHLSVDENAAIWSRSSRLFTV